MKNQHEGVQFYIVFAGKDYRYEKNSASRMRYSVYHQGRLVKGKLLRLPDPPTRLRIERLLIVELGLAVDIRVAVETCISSSDFSASFVIFISSIFKRLCQV